MRATRPLPFIASVLALGLLPTACAHHERRATAGPDEQAAGQAELLLRGGVIFTARDARETKSAMAVAGGKILAVGSAVELQHLVGPATRVIDLGGRFVGPGFHDAHLHFEGGGKSLATLNLGGLRSLEAVLQRVAAEVGRARPGAWISGRGWDHTLWPGRRWPTRQDLDRVAPDHPVYLRRVDGHVAWVNSKALAVGGVTAATSDPQGGEIAREADGKTPSGILKENAITLARPKPSAAASRRHLLLALRRAAELGVTSVQDGGSNIEELARLRDEGKLTLRVYAWGELDGDWARAEALRQRFPLPRAGQPSALLVFGALKGFVDGTLGSGTAALLAPYADEPKKRGILTMADDELRALVREASRRRFQVALHAIGDRAVRNALRAFEAALPEGAAALRHRVEHVQVIDPADLPLFAKTGAIASIQPCHLSTDQRWVDRRLGKQRAAARGYLWKRLAAAAPLAIGTDWPVEPVGPLRNLYAATTRRRIDPPHGPGWNVAQRLNIGEALRAYTHGGAHAAFAEGRRGTLEAGKDADFVLIDRNLLTVPPARLLRAKVIATVVGGKVIYGALPAARPRAVSGAT